MPGLRTSASTPLPKAREGKVLWPRHSCCALDRTGAAANYRRSAQDQDSHDFSMGAKELMSLMAVGKELLSFGSTATGRFPTLQCMAPEPRTYEEHLGALRPSFGPVYECLSNGSPDDFGTAQILIGPRSLHALLSYNIDDLLAVLSFCHARDRCDHSWKSHFFSNIFP